MNPLDTFAKHGDTDEKVKMSHGIADYWTKRQTVWSIVMVSVSLVIGAVVLLYVYDVL